MFDANSSTYDRQRSTPIINNYIICSTPRSGSTLLCRSLWETGLAGLPHEYFHSAKHMPILKKRWRTKDFDTYLQTLKKRRTTQNGVFGCKVHFQQYQHELQDKDLYSLFTNPRFIYICRKDHLKQAISLARGIQTKQWSSDEISQHRPVFDKALIDNCLQRVTFEEEGWEKFFALHHISPMRITYERFIDTYKDTVKAVLQYIGVNQIQAIPNFPLQKMADHINEDWYDRYLMKQSKPKPLPILPKERTCEIPLVEQVSAMPDISVLIYSYNFDSFIKTCIESILEQNLKPNEICIYDDCSTDDSWQIIESLCHQYPNRLIAHRNSQNIGMTSNVNFGMKRAQGEWVTWIDGDDRWLPDKLNGEWLALNGYPGAMLAYSNVSMIDANGTHRTFWDRVDCPQAPQGDIFINVFAKKFFPNNGSVFRNHLQHRCVFDSIGYMDEKLSLYIDWDFKIRATKRFHAAYNPMPMVEYRIHNGGIHNVDPSVHFNDVVAIFKKHVNLLKDIPARGQSLILKSITEQIKSLNPKINPLTVLSPIATEAGISLPITEGGVQNRPSFQAESICYRPSTNTCTSKSTQRLLQDAYSHRIKRRPLMDDSHIIFLISLPRSGSTLLQRVLSGHHDIHTTAEPWLMLHPLHAFKTTEIKSIYDQNLAAAATQDFLSTIPENMELYYQAVRAYGLTLYNRAIETSGKRLFLDKTPRYYSIIPELDRTFPNSRFIILLRNPMAVLSSVLLTWCNNDPSKLIKTLNYRDLVEGPKALIDGIKHLGDKASIVHYEELVMNPKACIKQLCAYLDIPFDNELLEYGRRKPPKGKFGDTVGIFQHQRPVNEKINKWVTNFSDTKLRTFATDYLYQLGSKTYTQLGYDFAAVESAIRSLHEQNGRTAIPNDDNSGVSYLLSSKSDQKLKYDKVISALHQSTPKTMIAGIHHFLDHHPDFSEAHNDLGVLYCNQDEHGKALKHYRKAVSIDGKNITFQKNLADFLFLVKHDSRSALKIYMLLLEQNRNDTEVLYAIGQVCLSLGNKPDADIFFQRILEIEPDHTAASQCLNKETQPIFQLTSRSQNDIFRVSAIVSTYASERFLEGRLQNLVDQTLFKKGELEIIVVDSNSPENERVVVERFKSQHSEIHYLRTPQRETVYAAWNRGIQMARGTYFVNANTDDRFTPDALEVMADTLDTHPEYDAAYGNWVVTRTPNDTFESTTTKRLFIYPEFHPGLFFYLQITSHANFVRRSVIDKIGLFDGSYTVFGDREFMFRFAANGHKALRLDKTIGLYLENPTSVERANIEIGRKECSALYSQYLAPESFLALMRYKAEVPAKKLSQEYTRIGCFGMGLYNIDGKSMHALGSPVQMFTRAIEFYPENVEALNNMGVITQYLGGSQVAIDFFNTAKPLANSAQASIIDQNLNLTRQNVSDANQLKFLYPSDFKPIRVFQSKYQGGVADHSQSVLQSESTKSKKVRVQRKSNYKRKKENKSVFIASQKNEPYDIQTHSELHRDIDQSTWQAYLMENYASAASSLLSMIANHPDHWEAYGLLVDVMLQSGQEFAIPEQLRPLEERSDLPAGVMALIGSGYEAAGDLARASAFADQALSLDAECARAWNLKGVLAFHSGDIMSAERHFKKAINKDVDWGEPWTNLGTVYWGQKDNEKGLDCFGKGFQLSPTAPNVATIYHMAISQIGQYDRAKPLFEDAVLRHPNFRKTCFLLIDILIRLEAFPAALDQIEAVLVRFGVDPQILEAAKVIRNKIGPMTIKKGKHPSLSLCMIVKNEEKYLPRCLESLKPVVDEMIVVDTGSTDATRDIAKVFGARVSDYEWHDDFAAARNFGLKQAAGDWVLVMDADELIAPSDYDVIRTLIREYKNEKVAFLITTRNYVSGFNGVGWVGNDGTYENIEAGCGWVPSTKTRLFKNGQKVKFEYPVHELVDPSLERNGIRTVSCHVPVHHYGCLESEHNTKKGNLYNLISKNELKAVHKDPKVLMELAVRSNMRGEYEDAIDLWNRLLKIQPANPNAFINLSATFDMLGQYVEAKTAAENAIKIAPGIKEGYLNLGRSEFFLGNFSIACEIFKKAILIEKNYYSAIFLLGLSEICNGDRKKGMSTINQLRPLSIWGSLTYAIQESAKALAHAGLREHAHELMLCAASLNLVEGSESTVNLFVKIDEPDDNPVDFPMAS